VRAVLPVLDHAEPRLVGLGQRDQRLAHLPQPVDLDPTDYR
jgi:hypothetical protein